jgi:beta-xylosidase
MTETDSVSEMMWLQNFKMMDNVRYISDFISWSHLINNLVEVKV